MRMLVSVRTVDEALAAAAGGADFIDLKEPQTGALGGLPLPLIRAIVAALRGPGATPALAAGSLVSATIGDLPMDDLPALLRQVDAVGACGVDYVKVGIDPVPAAVPVLQALAASRWAIVPVFIADRGIDFDLVGLVGLAYGFPAVMADTADKRAGSLFDVATPDVLQRFVERVRSGGALVGLAGALRRQHLPALAALGPDFAGFRSAVCAGDRGSALDPALLQALVADVRALRSRTAPAPG